MINSFILKIYYFFRSQNIGRVEYWFRHDAFGQSLILGEALKVLLQISTVFILEAH